MAVSGEKGGGNEGFLSSDDLRTGLISGATFRNKPVQYSVVNGLAVFEGCIVLGTVEDIERRTRMVREGMDPEVHDPIAHGVGITGEEYRWPNALLPYEIDPDLPNQKRVHDAIAHWEAKTAIRFVQRTNSNASQYPNYVYVLPADGCWSYVGMRGGRQDLGLASGCGLGSTIHEFGHALGLWHEQSREDRDEHIVIHWENIQSGREHNFNQHITDGDDYGPYDYDSIMHYPTWAFSKSGDPTITTIPPGIPIGQRDGLSDGDIATIHAMYKTWKNNVTVTRTYATYHSQNVWAHFSGLGWRKIKPDTNDGATSMFVAFCEAVANSRKVHIFADGSTVYRVQLV